MKNDYALAFIEIVSTGKSVEGTLFSLKQTLARKRHSKLLPTILNEIVDILEASKYQKAAKVLVAKSEKSEALKEEIKNALINLGIGNETPIIETVDETLIGGFVATFNNVEHNRSHKKALKSLFESITA